MLAQFQTALADLTASPDLARAARREPAVLRARYDLSEREWTRLTAIVRHPGMAANCMLYRANRLVPIALNFPRFCAALGPDALAELFEDYWRLDSSTNVHFLIEADRFGRFVADEIARDRPGLGALAAIHADEAALVAARLAASRDAPAISA